jgi:hypothetical protein
MSPADRDVLTSLPRSRSTRRSAKRGGTASTPAEGGAQTDAAKADAPKAKAPAKRAAAAKPKSAAKPKATAAKKTASAPKAKSATASKPKARRPSATSQATNATGSTAPPPPPAGWAAPKGDRAGERPGGGELLGTAVQAVGELAQIGLTFGGQALKQALSRFPRP